jgi:hypothetical protein
MIPPVTKLIPAPLSPLFNIILLSLIAKLSTSIMVSVPVTVRFLIETSLKKVVPLALSKSNPPASVAVIAISPT